MYIHYLIFQSSHNTLGDRYYHPHFVGEENEPQGWYYSPKVTQVDGARGGGAHSIPPDSMTNAINSSAVLPS